MHYPKPAMEKIMSNSEITQSKIIAKAVIMGSKIEIVTVFEKSNQRQCFFIFTAPKPAAPIAEWKLKTTATAYNLKGEIQTFEEFVTRAKGFSMPREICHIDYKFYPSRPDFIDAFDRIANPMNYLVKQDPEPGATFNYTNSITTGNYALRKREEGYHRTQSRIFRKHTK